MNDHIDLDWQWRRGRDGESERGGGGGKRRRRRRRRKERGEEWGGRGRKLDKLGSSDVRLRSSDRCEDLSRTDEFKCVGEIVHQNSTLEKKRCFESISKSNEETHSWEEPDNCATFMFLPRPCRFSERMIISLVGTTSKHGGGKQWLWSWVTRPLLRCRSTSKTVATQRNAQCTWSARFTQRTLAVHPQSSSLHCWPISERYSTLQIVDEGLQHCVHGSARTGPKTHWKRRSFPPRCLNNATPWAIARRMAASSLATLESVPGIALLEVKQRSGGQDTVVRVNCQSFPSWPYGRTTSLWEKSKGNWNDNNDVFPSRNTPCCATAWRKLAASHQCSPRTFWTICDGTGPQN